MSESDYLSGIITLDAYSGTASISIRDANISTSSAVWKVWFAIISNSLVYYYNGIQLSTGLSMDNNKLSLNAKNASISYKIIHFM